jgi:hypothetical protein
VVPCTEALKNNKLECILSIVVFWVVKPCHPVVGYQRFGGTYCLHFQDEMKDGRKAFLRKVVNHLQKEWAILSLPRVALTIHIFVDGRRKKINNIADSKLNYFFNSKRTARIHLKTDNKLSCISPQNWVCSVDNSYPQSLGAFVSAERTLIMKVLIVSWCQETK